MQIRYAKWTVSMLVEPMRHAIGALARSSSRTRKKYSNDQLKAEYIQRLKNVTEQLPENQCLLPILVTMHPNPSLPSAYRRNDTLLPCMADYALYSVKTGSVHVFRSKAAPVRILVVSTSGSTHNLLVKVKDDLRIDARVFELMRRTNELLETSGSWQSECRLKPYFACPLAVQKGNSPRVGVLEMLPNGDTMNKDIQAQYNGYMPTVTEYTQAEAQFIKRHAASNQTGAPDMEQFFKGFVNDPKHRPKWGLRWLNYPSLREWTVHKERFTSSLALWSALGYLLDLGDRHLENILISSVTSDIMHIDFEAVFGHAHYLPVVERVPFRLTPNVIHCLGTVGVRGGFLAGLEDALVTFKAGQASIRGSLESLMFAGMRQDADTPYLGLGAEASIRAVIRRINGDHRGSPLEPGVLALALTTEASDPAVLAQMFVGWNPFV
ncbi:hypothetical protein KIPB_001198 [Kipferlia bialata]|uniref:PI3K/PI4K catalytic domain-containing protein n=1 Tax=Kipferlia bialata TaxID=797122 RepID=A0A9K3CNF0_9EUKA|nr:hypothetical protein KIPB_001198 [Kipferlia bialata]|eukprot:g1198.t1